MLRLIDVEADDLEQKITGIFESIARQFTGSGQGDGIWTHAILEELAKFGNVDEPSVCPAMKPSGYSPEWLFDFVWYRYDCGSLKRLELILESEWAQNYNAIQYDFEKLLIAKCPHKVMVFQGSTRQIEKWIESLRGIVLGYENNYARERYFFIAYDTNLKRFRFQTTQVEARD